MTIAKMAVLMALISGVGLVAASPVSAHSCVSINETSAWYGDQVKVKNSCSHSHTVNYRCGGWLGWTTSVKVGAYSSGTYVCWGFAGISNARLA